MKIVIFILLLIPCTVSAGWFDTPSTNDIALETIWLGIHTLDWGQTLEISRHPNQFYEINPILGKHPNAGRVNTYMLTSAIIHPLISYALPKPYRKWWQFLSISTSGGLVIHNFNIGLKVKF